MISHVQLNEQDEFLRYINAGAPYEWDGNNYCSAFALEADGKAVEFKVFPFYTTAEPAHNSITQKVIELPPILVNGKWTQQWEVQELFSTEAEKDIAIAADIEAKRKASVPASVTRRQAKQALLLNGLLAGVQPAIDAIPDATQRAMIQIEWDDSQVFERDRPALIALGSALGLTNAQLDDLFIGAAQL